MRELDFDSALVFFAHPDDGEFMAGGSMIRWAAEGKTINLCVVTNGAMGSNDPDMKRQTLIESREREQHEAAAITGIAGITFLGYEDCQVADSQELRRDMIREIRRHKPDVVIGPDPTMYFFADAYINHPDHRQVGEALCAALSPGAATLPLYRDELYDRGFEPHHIKAALFGFTNQPNYWVDIGDYFDTKVKSVMVHNTQTPEFGSQLVDRMKMIASSMADLSDQGLKYAEAYRAIYFRDRD